MLTQKRGKIVIVPLSTELRDDLEAIYKQRKPHAGDRVLFNPETRAPFTSRVNLSLRAKDFCHRAGVKGSANCFRDTFACDMLARGNGIYEVAQMLADIVETVQRCYAQFVPAGTRCRAGEDGHRCRYRAAGQDGRPSWHEGRGGTRLNWLDELVRQRLEP